MAESEYGWDANPFTVVDAREAVTVAVKEGATSVQLLLGKLAQGAYVELLDESRNVISHIALEAPNVKIELKEGVGYVAIKNDGGLIETVFK